MDRVAGQKRAGALLYPQIEPFDQRMMDMGDGHRVYVEQCGHPDGAPVIVFHGGPGSTLEMRVFSRAALEREFRDAGFARVRVANEPYLPFGIHWPEPWSVPMVAYAPK